MLRVVQMEHVASAGGHARLLVQKMDRYIFPTGPGSNMATRLKQYERNAGRNATSINAWRAGLLLWVTVG